MSATPAKRKAAHPTTACATVPARKASPAPTATRRATMGRKKLTQRTQRARSLNLTQRTQRAQRPLPSRWSAAKRRRCLSAAPRTHRRSRRFRSNSRRRTSRNSKPPASTSPPPSTPPRTPRRTASPSKRSAARCPHKPDTRSQMELEEFAREKLSELGIEPGATIDPPAPVPTATNATATPPPARLGGRRYPVPRTNP